MSKHDPNETSRRSFAFTPATGLIAVFCICLIALAWANDLQRCRYEFREEVRRINEGNSALAHAFEEHVRHVVNTADNALLYLKRGYEKERSVAGGLKNFLELEKDNRIIVQAAVADAEGNLLYSAVALKAPINIADREHFKVHKENPGLGLFIGKPLTARATGTMSFFLSRRLNKPDGSFDGVVTIGLSPEYFSDYFGDPEVGEDRLVILVGQDRVVRARHFRNETTAGQDIGDGRLFKEVASKSSGDYETVSLLDQMPRFCSFRTMPDYPLIILVGSLKEETLAPFGQRRASYHRDAVLFSLFVAAFGCLLIRSERKSRRQTERLRLELEERRKAEEALLESERRFRELAQMLPEIVFETDAQGKFTFVNEKFFAATGYAEEDIRSGLSVTDFLAQEDRARAAENVREILAGDGTRECEFVIQGKSGNTFPAVIFVAPILHDGRPTGLRGIVVDLSRIKQAEAQLVQAQKMEAVGILAGGIAHDFNNILQGISGFISLVLMSGHLDEANEKWLKKAEISCARAAELVRGLLTFSRKKEVQLQSVDLNMEIRNSVAMLERTLPKTLQIELALSEKLLCLKGDPVQLEHILLNLASNANDATGGKGKIRIATESLRIDSPEKHWGIPPGDYLHLCVSDNGEGMDENTLRNLFNPFFTTKEVGKGTGLGLAIVYGLVKGHGGHIVCRSRKGEGTIFDLYFPATDECPEASFYASAPERLADDEGVRMLLVDDNHAVLETTGHAFEAMGFKVFQAACGEDALDLYREKRDEIDVVVLDVGMPGMGGIQCFKELRKIYPRCKVVFATGYCLPAIPRDEAGRPADAMLQKPYRIAELLKVIQEITKRGAA